MSPLLSFPFAFAVITAQTPAPGGTPAESPIHDIAGPVDVFPYPPWMVALAALLLLAILGLIVWAIVRWARKRPSAPPLTAEEVALSQLEHLRTRAGETEPYAFSFEVSDVLRTFIGRAKFRLPATNQTSPELLAAISSSPLFSTQDRALLGHFGEKCDMIKFARIHATSEDNLELVTSALKFVKGGQE